MLDKITEIMADKAVAEKLGKANTEAEAVDIIVAEAKARGTTLTTKDVADALQALATPRGAELTEAELAGVSGGMMASMSKAGDCGSNYGPSCPTKFQCSSNLCSSYKSNCR
jgi:hypothetical protein